MTLKIGMAADEIARRLGWNLARVPGAGRHQQSRRQPLHRRRRALAPVMATLRARHLFFFDSRTGAGQPGGGGGARRGRDDRGRDVFLDDDPQPDAVAAQLDTLAREAKRNGVAIAIGHPHDVTLTLLTDWLAQDHGVTLVPLDEAIRLKSQGGITVATR